MQEIYWLKIFKWLEKKVIDLIINNSKIEIFPPNTKILKQWDESNWKWYIIKNWQVKIIINWKEVTTLWSWDIFWEIALLNEEQRTASVESVNSVEAIIISQENIFELINNWNESINKDIMDRIEQNLYDNN